MLFCWLFFLYCKVEHVRAHCKPCCPSKTSPVSTLFELLNLIVGFDKLLYRAMILFLRGCKIFSFTSPNMFDKVHLLYLWHLETNLCHPCQTFKQGPDTLSQPWGWICVKYCWLAAQPPKSVISVSVISTSSFLVAFLWCHLYFFFSVCTETNNYYHFQCWANSFLNYTINHLVLNHLKVESWVTSVWGRSLTKWKGVGWDKQCE